ncbi:MAG: hypothetical protein U0L68_01415 [Prevotellamassilia sp.]|nr:hypothetical protein [Prevotellamassilia sp.]
MDAFSKKIPCLENFFSTLENFFSRHENNFSRHEKNLARHEKIFSRQGNRTTCGVEKFSRVEFFSSRHAFFPAPMPVATRQFHVGRSRLDVLTGGGVGRKISVKSARALVVMKKSRTFAPLSTKPLARCSVPR